MPEQRWTHHVQGCRHKLLLPGWPLQDAASHRHHLLDVQLACVEAWSISLMAAAIVHALQCHCKAVSVVGIHGHAEAGGFPVLMIYVCIDVWPVWILLDSN